MDIVLNDGLGSNYQTAKEKRLYQNRNILIQPPLFFYKPLRTNESVLSDKVRFYSGCSFLLSLVARMK